MSTDVGEQQEEIREQRRLVAQRYRANHKEAYNRYTRERKRERRKKALQLLGNKCFVCGVHGRSITGKSKLAFHEKSGNGHKDTDTASLALKNPEEFVLLCYGHHSFVHDCINYFGMSWDDFVQNLENHK